MTLRPDAELERALTALAAAEGTTPQEIIRRAVLERYERNNHIVRVQESANRLVDEWADALERLGAM